MENILVAEIRSSQSEFLDPALKLLDSTRKKEKRLGLWCEYGSL